MAKHQKAEHPQDDQPIPALYITTADTASIQTEEGQKQPGNCRLQQQPSTNPVTPTTGGET